MSERQETRVVAPVGVLLSVNGKRDACFTRNISIGGTFVMSKQVAVVGDTVTLSFVQAGNRLSTSARVASMTSEGLGLRFINASPEFCDGLTTLIHELLQKTGEQAARPSHQTGGGASWSYIPQQGLRHFLRRGKRNATLSGLSLDGAALEARRPPDVAEEILVYLRSPDTGDDLECLAKVVRHTDRGFAVKFHSPTIAFRRVVSDLRSKTEAKA